MVEANSAPLGTAYTVPVDHKSARTGITAAERAATIGLDAIDISLSHLADFAVAIVVCTQEILEQHPADARERLIARLRERGLLP